MKYLLAAVIGMTGISLQAHAGNSYCDSRQPNREVIACYKSGIEVHASQIKKNYQILMQSPKLSPQEKDALRKDQEAWINKVGQHCGSDVRCVHDAAKERNAYLYLRVHKS